MIGLWLIVVAVSAATFVLTLYQRTNMSHFGAAFDNLVASINDNTNLVSAQFDKLHEELGKAADAGDPITQEQLDKLSAINDHLKALGSDPQAPVPAVPAALTQPAPAPEPVVPVVVVEPAPVTAPSVPAPSEEKK